MDQRFKSTTDEVRKEDGRFYTHGTQIEREKQLIDKRRKINQTLEEEHVYAQLWALDAKKKHEREITEAADKAKAVAETMAVRDWQKNTREVVRQRDQDAVAQERDMLQQRWSEEETAEKNMAAQAHVLSRQRNQDHIEHNKAEEQLKKESHHAGLARDKDMLGQALDKEAAIAKIEDDERLARRDEVRTLQKFYQE